MAFIVDPKKVSASQIEADLDTFIANAPDGAAWTTFFSSASGNIVKKVVTSVGAFFNFKTVVARREAYLQYATQRSSILGISESLGHSVFKGTNARVTMTVLPNFTGVIERYSEIGTVKDETIYAVTDTPVTTGVSVAIVGIVGTLAEEDITVTTDTLSVFRFTATTSEDFRVLLNGSEIVHTTKLLDLKDDKFTALTNVFDSIDLFYLNNASAAVQYAVNDILKLQYITLRDLSFEIADVGFLFGTLSSTVISTTFIEAETKEEARINAPLSHEVQQVIRGREDYQKIFRGLSSLIADTQQRDVSSAVVSVTYVRDDNYIFSATEKAGFITELSSFRLFGVQPAEIEDPTRVPLKLGILITLKDNTGDSVEHVRTILATFENQLQQVISFKDLENLIEAADFVKTARLEIIGDEWAASSKYENGFHVKSTNIPTDKVFEFDRIVYKSGSTEPTTYPTIVGAELIDNEIVYQTLDTDLSKSLITWTADTEYVLDNFIVPTFPNGKMYRVVGFINESFGNTEQQKIAFDTLPDSGTFRVYQGTNKTGDLVFNANIATLQAALATLPGLAGITVTSEIDGYLVTFTGEGDNKAQEILKIEELGTDEQQVVSFSDIPTDGSWSLEFDGQTTVLLAFNATSVDVQTALQALSNIDTVSVTGDFSNGFTVTFTGVNAKTDVALITQPVVSDPGTDEQQTLSFDVVPTVGTWRLHFGSEYTTDMAFDADNTTIQSELNLLTTLSEVVVTGSYATLLTIDYQGSDGKKPQVQIDANNVGQNAEHTIQFSTVPTSGSWRITFDGEDTATLPSNASLLDIETALEALTGLTDVTVTGDYVQGIKIEYTGVDGLKPQNLLTVDSPGVNEVQELSFDAVPTSGTFKIDYDGQTTATISFDATAQDIEDALELLSNIDNVAVVGTPVGGTVSIEFQGLLANLPVVEVTTSDNVLSPATIITPSTPTPGKLLGSSLFRLESAITVTTLDTTPGLILGNSLTGVVITEATTIEGALLVTDLDRLGTAIDVTVTESVQGEVPANSLSALTIPTVITITKEVVAEDAEPTWPTVIGSEVTDGDIVWKALQLSGSPTTWQPGTDYKKGINVSPSVLVEDVDGVDLMFQCVGFLGTSGVAEPTWPSTVGDQITDNNIVWNCKDPLTSPNEIGFNEYYKFEETVVSE